MNGLRLKAVLASLIALTLSACAASPQRAGEVLGTLSAGVNMPDLPEYCRAQFQHAPITEGAELRAILVVEQDRLDAANQTIRNCANFYDNTANGLRPK